MQMSDEFRQRYSRQIRLPEVGERGQARLGAASVMVVGVGGLGSPVALYLAAAGVGRLQLVDYDCVDASNLQRQIAHHHADIGELKTDSAAAKIARLNPETRVEKFAYALQGEDFLRHTEGVDLLVDCSDNFSTRFDLNDVALKKNIPLVSGAAIRWEGQVTTFDSRKADSPCYQCLYPEREASGVTCDTEGVIAPLVGVIGAMQASESINVLLGKPRMVGVVWLFDAHFMEWQRMQLPKKPDCPACGK